uniref:Putative 60s ribosomal protein l10 n=1 Tax=Ixodes ricinus TaxID=34613 RepID=A0A090XC85_IXORI
MGRRPARCYRYCKNKPYPQVALLSRCPGPEGSTSSTWAARRPRWTSSPCACTSSPKEWEPESPRRPWRQVASAPTSTWLKTCGKDAFHLRMRLHPFHVIRINKMLSCAGADRLQTGMPRCRLASPEGHGWPGCTLARRSCLCVPRRPTKENVIEALRRAKFKFPGRQKVHVSKKWGLHQVGRPPSTRPMRADGRLKPDGCYCHYRGSHGPLTNWKKIQRELREVD